MEYKVRIKVELTSPDYIVLRKGFLRSLQGLIYKLLDKHSAQWLHNHGFLYEKRRFKLFTFSSILEKAKYDKKNSYFQFPRDISFYISSPVDWILEQIARNFVTGEEFYLNQNRLFLKSIVILQNINFKNEVEIKTINPIAMRSTDIKGKYKLYEPDDQFSELINKNLQKKWFALKGEECSFALEIVPIAVKKSVVWYGNRNKGCAVEGWKGTFYLKSESELLKFAYDTGLGERNSMGFGMIEMVKKEVI